jgi:hypothetical protein
MGVLALNGFNAGRADIRTSSSYLSMMQSAVAVARTLPDQDGDGDIRLMTQDPYILRFLGLRSVMFPYEPRDVILEVAARYRVDYLLMPPNRPALDDVYLQTETDPRLTVVQEVPGSTYEFWAINP